jgi:hypothetical protein
MARDIRLAIGRFLVSGMLGGGVAQFFMWTGSGHSMSDGTGFGHSMSDGTGFDHSMSDGTGFGLSICDGAGFGDSGTKSRSCWDELGADVIVGAEVIVARSDLSLKLYWEASHHPVTEARREGSNRWK